MLDYTFLVQIQTYVEHIFTHGQRQKKPIDIGPIWINIIFAAYIVQALTYKLTKAIYIAKDKIKLNCFSTSYKFFL